MIHYLRSGVLWLLAIAVVSLALHRAANRDALRAIVQGQCAAHWLQHHDPAPCARIYLPAATAQVHGYAVLADRNGGAHFLLIPLATLSGIESPEILDPATPNYFAAAWHARDRVSAAMGRSLPREDIGLAINSRYTRSQDQLHIHIECLRPQVYRALQAAAGQLRANWSPLIIAGWTYQGLRVNGEDLDQIHPFALLADRLPQAHAAMGAYTLAVAGMQFKDGPGFIVLAGRLVPGGETLLDSTCAIARH